MARNRKIQKGVPTKALCFLANVGGAPSSYLARYFNLSENSMQRVMDKLEDKGLATMSTVMNAGSYRVITRGYTVANHTRCAPFMASRPKRPPV